MSLSTERTRALVVRLRDGQYGVVDRVSDTANTKNALMLAMWTFEGGARVVADCPTPEAAYAALRLVDTEKKNEPTEEKPK